MSFETYDIEQFVPLVDDWITKGGPFPDFACYYAPKSLEEVERLVRALMHGDFATVKYPLLPNMEHIASMLLTYDEQILAYLREHAVEPLRLRITEHLTMNAPSSAQSELELAVNWRTARSYLVALSVLVRLGQADDTVLLVRVARKPVYYDHLREWESIFHEVLEYHPNPEDVLNRLREPLPEGFCRTAYLDLANALCFENRVQRHPFDTDEGFDFLMLRAGLVRESESHEDFNTLDKDGFVISAIKAAAFLSKERSELLLKAVGDHEMEHVRREASWAKARRGGHEGIRYLNEQFQTVRFHFRAKKYLSALGIDRPDIQATNTEQFIALAVYVDQMAKVHHWGYPLDRLKVIDQLDVIWPEPDQITRFWLVAFDTKNLSPEKEQRHEGERRTGFSLVSPFGCKQLVFEKDRVLSGFAHAVAFHKNYQALVEDWPDKGWCAKRLEELNPELSKWPVKDWFALRREGRFHELFKNE